MKKQFIFLLFFTLPVYAQLSFTGCMGINYFANPSLKDYFNMNYPSNSGLVSTFNASVGFYGELSIPVGENYDLGVEYMYQIYSYNAPSLSGGIYNFSLDQQKISLLGYYIINGDGFKIRFGAGGGLRLGSVDEEIYSRINYTSTGFGLLTRAEGVTPLGKNIFANIGVEAGYDLTGEPSNGNQKIVNTTLNKNINLNAFFIGLKIGVTYRF